MLLFQLPFKLNASWSGQTPLFSQFLFTPNERPFGCFGLGRRMRAATGFGGVKPTTTLCLALVSPPLSVGSGQDVCRDSLLSCNHSFAVLRVSCYQFQWIWFVTSICTITRNLIRLCACQMIQMSGADAAKAILTSQTLLQRGLRMTC